MNYDDISNYTDEELYEILDLDSPSDGELEARIIQKINVYKDGNTEDDKLLASFFSSIYDHFFEPENVMGGVVDDEEYEEEEYTGKISEIEKPDIDKKANDEGDKQEIVAEQKNIELTKPVTVASGTLNPVLQQTVKRIMSIDSQYRDDNYQLSTNFTFNLSEPLRDVLALRLYSISIPYTWYTVNKNFGSNFIWLKGNVPGIKNGDYDYKFEIGAGNYTQLNLVNAINDTINTIKQDNTDVSFSSTQLTYDGNSSKATFKINIEKNYNELSYYVYFPVWTSPNDPTPNDPINPGQRFRSIPGFLGFNFDTYYINSITSTRFIPINDDIPRFDVVDGVNNMFNIIVYEGPDEYETNVSSIEYTITVTLNLENGNATYTRNQLFVAINNALTDNNNLTSESSFYKTTINNPDVIDNGKSFFTLSIYLNRNNVFLTPKSKVYIEFPDESAIANDTKHIWTGVSSCFRIASRSYELNDITGETPIIKQEDEEIVVDRNLYIEIKCVNPYGYGSSTNNIYDNSLNDYVINVPTSDQIGYTLGDFVNAFNVGLIDTIDNSVTTNNPDGEINRQNSKFSLLDGSKVKFQMDILKIFNNNDYHGDISNTTYGQSFLSKTLNIAKGSVTDEYIDGSFVNLGETNTFTAQFPTNTSYTIDTSFVLALYPTSNGNNKADPYIVNIELPIVLSQDVSYHSFPITINNAIDEIPAIFNKLFTEFKDDDEDEVLSNCSLSVFDTGGAGNQGLLTAELTVNVEKYLDETDFSIQFFDPSLSQGQIDISDTYYVSDLEFNPDYVYDPNIGNPAINLSSIYQQDIEYSIETLSLIPITVNQITLDETNNTFKLIPHESGVTSSNDENDITITIPPDTYNRTELIIEMNDQLSKNIQTQNAYFNIIEDSTQNKEYIRFHTNILKQYTTEDFKLEFYSEETFTSCYASVSSVRSTSFDATLGWLLGFRNRTIYELNDTTIQNSANTNHVITIEGDSTVSVELYDKLFLVIDDYNQNRLNDGLITNVPTQEISTLPSYALRNSILCDPGSQTSRVSANEEVNFNRLTERQLYSIDVINNTQANSYSKITNRKLNPYSKDTFAVIPIKVSSLQNGDLYTEFGGTLQNQERIYFGPVNIKRMTVKLMTDRGDPVDLNNADWNFSLIAEQLYQNQTQ